MTRIHPGYTFRLRFLYFLLLFEKKKNNPASERKEKQEKNPLRDFSLRRYPVARYAVTRFTNNPILVASFPKLTLANQR